MKLKRKKEVSNLRKILLKNIKRNKKFLK